MKILSGTLLTCVVALALAGGAPAQTTGAPGVNDFTINGIGSGGTTPVDPGLVSAAGSVTLAVSGPPGQLVFGLAANSIVPGAFAFPPVALGSVDLDLTTLAIWLPGPQVVPGWPIGNTLDSNGDWVLTMPVAFQGGEAFNLQVAIYDPLAGTFAMTQAHSGSVAGFSGIVTTLPPFSYSTLHGLTVPITFYGATHNFIDVMEFGYVTFGQSWGSYTPSMVSLFTGFPDSSGIGGYAGVAAAWSDVVDNGGGSYTVYEDTANNVVKIEFANLEHYGTPAESAGVFSIEFGGIGPGSVTIDLTNYTAALTSGLPGPVVGVTDGNLLGNPNIDLGTLVPAGYAGQLGLYTSASPGESIGEHFPSNTPLPVTVINFAEIGTPPGNGTWAIY